MALSRVATFRERVLPRTREPEENEKWMGREDDKWIKYTSPPEKTGGS